MFVLLKHTNTYYNVPQFIHIYTVAINFPFCLTKVVRQNPKQFKLLQAAFLLHMTWKVDLPALIQVRCSSQCNVTHVCLVSTRHN